ncbi:MAG: hypothetical protein ACTSVY_10005 [Candidatus Helarchaeota archaeon]
MTCPHCHSTFKKLKFFIYNRDKFTCQSCNTHENKLQHGNFLTQHHLLAKCNGMTHKVETINNNVTWCWKCHQEYNKKHPIQKIEVLVAS